jgi:O-succinylbenzoic acid--CoA ligase
MQCQVLVNDNDPKAMAEAEVIRYWAVEQPELQGHLFFATSGSTGNGRWVALSRAALLSSARVVNEHLGVTADDRWLLALPTFHVGGLGVLARSYAASCSVVVMEEKWDAEAYHRLCCENKATFSSLVPTQMVDLVNGGVKAPSSLRAVLIGGGRLEDSVYEKAVDLGWPVVETYGMTETCSQVATAMLGQREMKILPSWETKLDYDGRLMLTGEAVLTGYVTCIDNHCVFTDPKKGGWLVTDDIAEINEGCIIVKGRADRCVKVLGELVNLDQVQREFAASLGVDEEFPVVSLPDIRRGAKLIACTEQVDVSLDLLEKYNAQCNPLHRIESVQRVEILRSPLGKVRYSQLQTQLMRQKRK